MDVISRVFSLGAALVSKQSLSDRQVHPFLIVSLHIYIYIYIYMYIYV